MEERLEWGGCAKAIGIVLVVYGHVARGVHSAGLFAKEELFALTDNILERLDLTVGILKGLLVLLPLVTGASLAPPGRRLRNVL